MIRPEQPEDAEAIRDIINLAFDGKPYAGGDEAELVNALRARGALVLSLVAEVDGKVVGQIAFSPASSSQTSEASEPADAKIDWYGLGPVAVLPTHQGQGIGSKLINEGLKIIRDRGARGCILTGDPLFYRRFGFSLSPENVPPTEPAEYFMALLIRGSMPAGPIHFHETFYSKPTD